MHDGKVSIRSGFLVTIVGPGLGWPIQLRALKGLNVHIAALMSGHDDLANYKAELDTRGKLPEQMLG